jgi:DNA-binding NtrC family response regulator
MTQGSTKVLALVPDEMQRKMTALERAVIGSLTSCHETVELVQHLRWEGYSVVLLPATLPSQEWWNIWGVVNTMERRPSILVYAVRSDFQTWSGILEAGGFDVVVAPFTQHKLQEAISAATHDYEMRTT